ncbi:MAG: metallophosphoesterase [Planctomycetes bacterium]|nr:metallophosphoesterase [Planctomycetota bacterium]
MSKGHRLAGAAVLALFAAGGAARGATVSGVVFRDRDGDGARREGEEGIPGVPITDGLTFVSTDADGRFAIEPGEDPILRAGGVPIISIHIPNGLRPTTPWFRRLDDPAVEGAIAFGLRDEEQSLPFIFVHGTDPHVPRGGKDRFITFRSDLQALRDTVRFCILTGDLVDLSDSHSFAQGTAEYGFLAAETRDFPVPLFCISGNHDIAGVRAGRGWDEREPRTHGYGFFTHVVGPLRWSFTYAGIHFAGVDFNRLDGDKWSWGVPDSAIAWLERDLALREPGMRTFLFVHFPQGPDSFKELVARGGVTQIFHGHDHVDRESLFGGVPCLSSGSIAEVFGDEDRTPGYRLVRVTEDGFESFYRSTGHPHAIAVDFPRRNAVVRPGDALRGAFYDPKERIRGLAIRIGEREEGAPFQRGPLSCGFAVAPDLREVTAGIRPIALTVTDGQSIWGVRRTSLLLTDRLVPLDASEDAVLEIDGGGIDAGAVVRVNGEAIADLAPTALRGDADFAKPVKGTEVRSIPVPRARLWRLNRIDLVAGLHPDGTPDRFCVLDVRMRYAGKVFRDVRLGHGDGNPAYVGGEAARWIDLRPGE